MWPCVRCSAAGCVARRMCALVGCGTSPSGSSIESQAIESLADPTATALDADGPAATSGACKTSISPTIAGFVYDVPVHCFLNASCPLQWRSCFYCV